MSVRNEQFKAAHTMSILLLQELPTLSWYLSGHGSGVEGQVSNWYTKKEVREVVHEWAKALGTTVTETPSFTEDYTSVSTEGTYGDYNVRVRVWGHADKVDV